MVGYGLALGDERERLKIQDPRKNRGEVKDGNKAEQSHEDQPLYSQ